MFNTYRFEQNGQVFADDTFKCIYINKNIKITNKISQKYISMNDWEWVTIAFVQMMAWCQMGNKLSFNSL